MPAGWVEAGAAVLGAGESIMSNNSAKSAANQNNAAASTLQGAQNTMLNQAESVANQPFQAYTGTLTAPLAGNQQQAVSQASTNAIEQPGQADVTAGTNLLGSEQPWNASTAQTYMNPYTQDVTDAALAQQNKSYLQSMAQQQTGAGASDSFGNSRNAIAEADLTANNSLNTATLTASNNAAAYSSAMQAWQADNTAKTSAATAYMNAGNDVTNMNNSQIQDLLQTGGVAQVTAQTNLSNQYAQFMRQQGWSAQQLQSLIQGVGTAKGNAQVSPAVQSNVGNSLLGLGSTLAGLSGGGSSGGGSTNSSNPGNLGGSSPTAPPGSTLTYDADGNITGYCDYATKTDVNPLYLEAATGLQVYGFRYKSEEGRWIGYLAHEVQKKYPEAVLRGPRGFLMVNYAKIPSARIRKPEPEDWAELDKLIAAEGVH